jgi:hypothetical protein
MGHSGVYTHDGGNHMAAVVLMALSASLATVPPVSHAHPATVTFVGQQSTNGQSPTEFYLQYRKTALAAKSVDEILAFWSSQLLHEFKMEPVDARAGTLTMVKRMESSVTDVRVVKETTTSKGATLTLEAIGQNKKPMSGTVDLVKENGAWKLVEAEQWKPKG